MEAFRWIFGVFKCSFQSHVIFPPPKLKNCFIYHQHSHGTNIKNLRKARPMHCLRPKGEPELTDNRLCTQSIKETASNNFVMKLHPLKMQHWADFSANEWGQCRPWKLISFPYFFSPPLFQCIHISLNNYCDLHFCFPPDFKSLKCILC